MARSKKVSEAAAAVADAAIATADAAVEMVNVVENDNKEKAKGKKAAKAEKPEKADKPEKRTRVPSAYNIFVKEFLLNFKNETDEKVAVKDKMKLAAIAWKKSKAEKADEAGPSKVAEPDPEDEEESEDEEEPAPKPAPKPKKTAKK
jgi:hypothetical protein